MTRAIALVALVASLPLLAGCVAAPAMPAPLTPTEIADRYAAQQLDWWQSMFPDEPMPVVEPIEVIDPASPRNALLDCVSDANLPGVTVSGGGFVDTEGGGRLDSDLNRQLFICSAQYPYDTAEMGYLSDAEMEWIYYYNRDRLLPCLKLQGYAVTIPTGRYEPGSYDFWMPYNLMSAIPTDDWARIDLACPPSPIGPTYFRGPGG